MHRSHKASILIILIVLLTLSVAWLINTGLFISPDYETITNREAAKLIAALEADFEDIQWKDEDTYLNYLIGINVLYGLKGGDAFNNNSLLKVLSHLSVDASLLDGYDIKLKSSKRPVERDVFFEIYDDIIKTLSEQIINEDNSEYAAGGFYTNIEPTQLTIMATPGSTEDVLPWNVYTDKGLFTFYGLYMDGYLDSTITAYVRGSEVIAVRNVESTQVTYRNVWIYEGNSNGVTVYLDGIDRTFYTDGLASDISEVLGDLYLVDKSLVMVSVKTDRINGRVLSVTDDYVEIEGYGRVMLDPQYRVFNNYNGFEQISSRDILVGYELEDFIVADGMICGVIVNYPLEVGNIRVMIRNDGFESIYHDTVTVSCVGDYYIYSGSELENVSLVSGGVLTTFEINDERIVGARVRIVPVSFDDRIAINSITRSQGTPEYPGTLEISSDDNGIYVINDVDMEQYLKLVVPSEMPAGYGVEAAKVQAVCARSYAYNQLLNNDYRQYGAHIDDSTWYQVYNNTQEYAASSRAVDETRGEVMCADGSVITAYYYSTSCGYGSDISIWGQDISACSYITAHAINPDATLLDLTDNDTFNEFITGVNDEDFESSFALYRWHTTLSLKEINNLYRELAGVGEITSIKVTERLNGGIANQVVIIGLKGEYTITGENTIRKTLGDASITWINNKGNEFSMSSMPSAFISIVPVYKKGSITGYTIYGGGYGHGLGMSQNGAYAMTQAGYSYREILEFFYDGVEIETIY